MARRNWVVGLKEKGDSVRAMRRQRNTRPEAVPRTIGTARKANDIKRSSTGRTIGSVAGRGRFSFYVQGASTSTSKSLELLVQKAIVGSASNRKREIKYDETACWGLS